MMSCVRNGSDGYYAEFSVWDRCTFTVFTISAMTISYLQCTHTVSLLLSRTASSAVTHTNSNTHFLLVSLSCLCGTADTTTVLSFRAISVPAQSVLL